MGETIYARKIYIRMERPNQRNSVIVKIRLIGRNCQSNALLIIPRGQVPQELYETQSNYLPLTQQFFAPTSQWPEASLASDQQPLLLPSAILPAALCCEFRQLSLPALNLLELTVHWKMPPKIHWKI